MVTTSLAGRVLETNEAMQHMFRRDAESFHDLPITELRDDPDGRLAEAFQALVAGRIERFQDELRWNRAYYRLAQGL